MFFFQIALETITKTNHKRNKKNPKCNENIFILKAICITANSICKLLVILFIKIVLKNTALNTVTVKSNFVFGEAAKITYKS